MQNKFQIRSITILADEALQRWQVISPNNGREYLLTFPDAIKVFDLWIEEYCCRILTTEKRARADQEAEIARA